MRIHREVMQLQLALCIDSEPAKETRIIWDQQQHNPGLQGRWAITQQAWGTVMLGQCCLMPEHNVALTLLHSVGPFGYFLFSKEFRTLFLKIFIALFYFFLHSKTSWSPPPQVSSPSPHPLLLESAPPPAGILPPHPHQHPFFLGNQVFTGLISSTPTKQSSAPHVLGAMDQPMWAPGSKGFSLVDTVLLMGGCNPPQLL